MPRRLPDTPWLDLHRALLSDSQLVCSHPVLPARILGLGLPKDPRPAPCSVTLADPVVAMPFPPRAVLIRLLSTDHATLTLPPRCPALTAARRLPATPVLVWHRMDVSDSQADCSHPVPAALACPDPPPTSPSPPPDIVRLDAPVAAALDLRIPLAQPMSPDTAADKLPTCLPADTSTRTLPV